MTHEPSAGGRVRRVDHEPFAGDRVRRVHHGPSAGGSVCVAVQAKSMSGWARVGRRCQGHAVGGWCQVQRVGGWWMARWGFLWQKIQRILSDVFIYLSLLGRLLTSTKPLSRSSRAGADPRKPEIRACLLLFVGLGRAVTSFLSRTCHPKTRGDITCAGCKHFWKAG